MQTEKSRADQLQPTGEPHNSLSTRLRTARLYTHITTPGGGEGMNYLEGLDIQTINYTRSMVE